jgi:hypothetical protein
MRSNIEARRITCSIDSSSITGSTFEHPDLDIAICECVDIAIGLESMLKLNQLI